MHLNSLVFIGLASGTFAHQRGAISIPEECLSSVEHPPATVTQSDGVYTQCYTTVYTQIGPTGLHPETYTITETCHEPVCRYPLETAPPPGFTTGVVSCDICHNGGPVTTTLTFPLASLAGYSSLGSSHGHAAPTGNMNAPITSPTAAPTAPTATAAGPAQAGAGSVKFSAAAGAVLPVMFMANLLL